MPNDPELLYHYTNQQGFLGITASRELWACVTKNVTIEPTMIPPIVKASSNSTSVKPAVRLLVDGAKPISRKSV